MQKKYLRLKVTKAEEVKRILTMLVWVMVKKNCKSDRHSKRLCQCSDSVTPSVVYIHTENHRLIGTAIAMQTARDSKTDSDRESDTDNNNNRRDSLTV